MLLRGLYPPVVGPACVLKGRSWHGVADSYSLEGEHREHTTPEGVDGGPALITMVGHRTTKRRAPTQLQGASDARTER